MRYLVYTTAAYGAHGIYYYVYCRKGHVGSIVALDGTPDAKYEALKTLQVNPEVSTISWRTPLEPSEEMSLYRYFKAVEVL